MKLGDKVYCYWNTINPLIEGRIIQITSIVEEIFYKGKAYKVDFGSGIDVFPTERVFAKYSEWEEYFNSICNNVK